MSPAPAPLPDDAPDTALAVLFAPLAANFGLSRAAGQILGLLVLAPEPLAADDLVAALGISRSNVSTGLKELRAWNLIRLSRRPDDRRDHVAAAATGWALLQRLAAGRLQREVLPLRAALRALPDRKDAHATQEIKALRTALGRVADWTAALDGQPVGVLAPNGKKKKSRQR